MGAFDVLIAEIQQAAAGAVQAAGDAAYASSVASGKLSFDINGMTALIGQLRDQLNEIKQAQRSAQGELGGVRPESSVSDVSGLNSAWRWLSSTAVDGTGLVSFQDNLKELDKLVQYLHDQLTNVRNAYIAADSASQATLNSAAASVFDGNRRPDEVPVSYGNDGMAFI